MSRFIDALNRVARVTSQPMGFGTNRAAAAGSRLLLVADLNQCGDATGADAVLLRQDKTSSTAAALKKAVDALPEEVPWGSPAGANAKKTATLLAAGCDFLIFTAESPVVSMPGDEKVGRVLKVEPALDDGLLRTINDLPVDAVLVAGKIEGGSMAWQGLMQLQRLSNLLSKPLLAAVTAKATEVEIKALWEAGVDGVIAEAENAGELAELRKVIDGLPPRSARQRGNNEAILPRLGLSTSSVDEEEEDDDWDDE